MPAQSHKMADGGSYRAEAGQRMSWVLPAKDAKNAGRLEVKVDGKSAPYLGRDFSTGGGYNGPLLRYTPERTGTRHFEVTPVRRDKTKATPIKFTLKVE